MKTRTRLLLLLLLFACFIGASAEEVVRGSGDSNEHLFVLKTDHKTPGALIEIFSSTGERVFTKKLMRRKVIIDFGNVQVGEYTIRIRNGNDSKEYKYLKK
jgi:hypothetical protein